MALAIREADPVPWGMLVMVDGMQEKLAYELRYRPPPADDEEEEEEEEDEPTKEDRLPPSLVSLE
jgi:hypothetical protein